MGRFIKLPFVFTSHRSLAAQIREACLQGQVLQARRTKVEMADAHGAHQYGATIANLEDWAWHRLRQHRGQTSTAPARALYSDIFGPERLEAALIEEASKP